MTRGDADMGCIGVCLCSERACVYGCMLVGVSVSDGSCAGVAHFSVCVRVCFLGV